MEDFYEMEDGYEYMEYFCDTEDVEDIINDKVIDGWTKDNVSRQGFGVSRIIFKRKIQQ